METKRMIFFTHDGRTFRASVIGEDANKPMIFWLPSQNLTLMVPDEDFDVLTDGIRLKGKPVVLSEHDLKDARLSREDLLVAHPAR